MKLVEYVPDHILRNYLKVGQKVTILTDARVHVLIPKLAQRGYSLFHGWYSSAKIDPKDLRDDLPRELCHVEYVTLGFDHTVEITNFLPGYTEVYADMDGKRRIHNHQVVWIEKDGLEYHSTDVNNVKEVRDA